MEHLCGADERSGPRPALWNQYDLIEAGQIQGQRCDPGLTGWAQVNGRDELEIPVKARLDGSMCSIWALPWT